MKKISFLIVFLLAPTHMRGYSKEQQSSPEPKLNTAFMNPQTAMKKEQVAKVIAKAGFPKEMVPLVTCLAEHESHFRPNAVNLNTNRTRDYGLLQINDVWLKGCNTTATNLTKPLENAKCAYKIYKTQGLTAWTTYKTHKNTCLSYQVNELSTEDLLADAHIQQEKIPGLM